MCHTPFIGDYSCVSKCLLASTRDVALEQYRRKKKLLYQNLCKAKCGLHYGLLLVIMIRLTECYKSLIKLETALTPLKFITFDCIFVMSSQDLFNNGFTAPLAMNERKANVSASYFMIVFHTVKLVASAFLSLTPWKVVAASYLLINNDWTSLWSC